MKKLFGLVIILFILYFSLQILFVFIGNGHTINYQIVDGNKTFHVHEKFISNEKKDNNGYYINVNIGDNNFDIVTYENFKRSSEIVKTIKYYEDKEYKCLFVKYRDNKILNDVLCNDGKNILPYHNIENPSQNLKIFILNLTLEGYREERYIDDISLNTGNDIVSLYSNNIIKNHFVGMLMNNSLYRFNNLEQIGNTNLSNKELNSIKGFTNDKLLTITYEDKDTIDCKIYSITSSNSFDLSSEKKLINPIILGGYGESLYVYDKETKSEYEIDTENKKILEIGSDNTLIKYYTNGKWQNSEINDIDIDNIDFGNEYANDYVNKDFYKTIKVGNKIGYYYYFKKTNDKYKVYRSTIDNKENLTYLFTTTSIKNIQFLEDYVYYIDGNKLKYYNNLYGNRTLVESININNDNIFKVFIDKTKEA